MDSAALKLSFPRPLCHSRALYVIPAPFMSFPRPLCHSRAGGNPVWARGFRLKAGMTMCGHLIEDGWSQLKKGWGMVRDFVSSALGLCLLVSCSCVETDRPKARDGSEEAKVRLVTLAPGHYHAALVQKSMYDQGDGV